MNGDRQLLDERFGTVDEISLESWTGPVTPTPAIHARQPGLCLSDAVAERREALNLGLTPDRDLYQARLGAAMHRQRTTR